MANPRPNLENLRPFRPLGDRPLGKLVGTRYPVEVDAALRRLGRDKQALIRAAVETELRERGLL
jgi:hypothetical protein